MSTDVSQKTKGSTIEKYNLLKICIGVCILIHQNESKHRPYTFRKNEFKMNCRLKYKKQTTTLTGNNTEKMG